MTFLVKPLPDVSHRYRRSNTPTISTPLPFPPSYYDQKISTPVLSPPPVPTDLVNPDYSQHSSYPAPPHPGAAVVQHTQNPYYLPNPVPPPLEDHPAYRVTNHSTISSNRNSRYNDCDKKGRRRHTFIPYSPSDYDISRLSVLSTPHLPPTPPNSPPLSPSLSPASSHTRSTTSAWVSPVQPVQQHGYFPKWHRHLLVQDRGQRTSGASTHASLNSDTDLDHSSSGSADLSDILSGKLNEVITSIDGQEFSGMERDLRVQYSQTQPSLRGGESSLSSGGARPFHARKRRTSPPSSINYFSKVYHYANSRLPDCLTPLRLYIPTYPLLCLAARFSQRAYSKPTGAERETRVEADWHLGTKAMVIKSELVDNMNVIVFAVRGTHTFRDWATNVKSDPTAPDNFLDDYSNLCHAGFLSVARRMVKPVAARLQQILDENPSRISCSLVITGHSAGGAIASLLYMHMLSETVKTDLVRMRDYFKRVHCITFGAPPVSLWPLQKPTGPGRERFQKWLFFSFVNEGDPVPRADKAYVCSLVDLYVSPAPPLPSLSSSAGGNTTRQSTSTSLQQKFHLFGGGKKRDNNAKRKDHHLIPTVVWKTPPALLYVAGNVILLRGPHREQQEHRAHGKDHAEAFLMKNDDLQNVVFGDPMMHVMELYERRIEILATNAVTARFSLQ
ncbi:uncharacterized protein PADG_07242 [Paracoccidioides brasiliensis Pb18]|uniref:Fungal lipase-type domain-containing protein n=1 Tax=Paracoccidioides brasiliensis (strain Pb18) TaxID=502780 RepID=C1GJ06_PARBD|nr:uncharacterized protein PADG_07242 [Paracoccidioides brasiliensis Pb18]EEH42422.1 hypothetical protein PADG_07242 [Paracoccidioides brasiliensis Pb18]